MSTTIHYLGHSTVLLEINGAHLITDPVFRRRIFFLHRTAQLVLPPQVDQLDAVLISHLHHDHLDIQTLKQLKSSPKIFAPAGSAKLLQKHKFANFQELQIGDRTSIGGVELQAIYADHTRGRNPLGIKSDCIGYLIKGETNIYFPGDTRFFPGMGDLAPDLDVALMPVWGWGPHRGRMHMSPKEAAEALTTLKPKLAIPIHWGTYLPTGLGWLRPGFHYIPPLEFSRVAGRVASEVEIKILKPGESIQLTTH